MQSWSRSIARRRSCSIPNRRAAASCMEWSNRVARPRPPRLDAYMAVSASRRRSSGVSYCSPSSTTPTLAPGVIARAPRSMGVPTAASTTSATSRRTADSVGTMTPNSSPPSRATRASSTAPSAVRRRLDTVVRRVSPASCPSESLTTLNRSRSTNRTPNGSPSARAASIRSRNRARLGSPVRTSWEAWCRSRADISRRSVTSRETARIPRSSPASSRRTLDETDTNRRAPDGAT